MTEHVRAVVERYVEQEDMGVIHPEAVFVDVSSGTRHQGRAEISQMFHHWYTDPFNADASLLNVIVGDTGFVAEYEWEGDHIGEWRGIAATNRRAMARFAVVYEVEGDHITSAHVYMPYSVIEEQLS